MNIITEQTRATSTVAVATTASSAKQSVGGDDFIKLLMAQLKNQDPTHPMDPSQMVSQLATVSQVAQTQQMNSTLSQMLSTSALSQAEQVIGRTVTGGDGSITGKVVSVTIGSGGIIATLDNGSLLSLQGDIKISA